MCGSVTFQFDQEPTAYGFCHCKTCQKASGTACGSAGGGARGAGVLQRGAQLAARLAQHQRDRRPRVVARADLALEESDRGAALGLVCEWHAARRAHVTRGGAVQDRRRRHADDLCQSSEPERQHPKRRHL